MKIGLSMGPNSRTYNKRNEQFWLNAKKKKKLREMVGHSEGWIEHGLKG
jgi:hypothetical protein